MMADVFFMCIGKNASYIIMCRGIVRAKRGGKNLNNVKRKHLLTTKK